MLMGSSEIIYSKSKLPNARTPVVDCLAYNSGRGNHFQVCLLVCLYSTVTNKDYDGRSPTILKHFLPKTQSFT